MIIPSTSIRFLKEGILEDSIKTSENNKAKKVSAVFKREVKSMAKRKDMKILLVVNATLNLN